MLQFRVKPQHPKIKEIPSSYPALLGYETNLTILIDNEIFFDEPDFPVLEFLKYAIEWKENASFPFRYNSIETEENPLISFSYENDMLRISSPWQKFHCKTLFRVEEIIDAITVLLADIVSP